MLTADDEQQESAEHPQAAEIRANVTSMLFVELLFWKNQVDAAEVRGEYHWQVDPPPTEQLLNFQIQAKQESRAVRQAA